MAKKKPSKKKPAKRRERDYSDRITPKVEGRVRDIEAMIANFVPPEEIVQYCKKTWKVERRQAERYIRIATRRIGSLATPEEVAAVRPKLIRAFQLTAQAALSKDRFHAAIRALREVGLLCGAYPDRREYDPDDPPPSVGDVHLHQHQHLHIVPVEQLTPEERAREILKLEERRRRWIESGGNPLELVDAEAE